MTNDIPNFNAIRRLDEELIETVPNQNDRVDMLINAIIAEGVTTEGRIIGAISHLGYNNRHVAVRLKNGVMRTPEFPQWGRDAAGQYFAPEQQLPAV